MEMQPPSELPQVNKKNNRKKKYTLCVIQFRQDLVTTVKKYGILFILMVAMFLLGILLNQLPSKNPKFIPLASWCHHSQLYKDQKAKLENLTLTIRPPPDGPESQVEETKISLKDFGLMYIPRMPKGLHTATAVVYFVWPLMPLLLHIRHMNDAKLESFMAHILGQTSNFGIAELFRTQIMFPEDLFLDKCNVTPDECLLYSYKKEALRLYLPPSNVTAGNSSSNTPRSFCRGQFLNQKNGQFNDSSILYDSLHHYPDPICMLLGASIVSFITNMCQWRNINPTTKSIRDTTVTKRSFLAINDIAMLSITLFYLHSLYMTYDLLQLLGLLIGVPLQLMINRTISYAGKKLAHVDKNIIRN
jgi:hypothetical protein